MSQIAAMSGTTVTITGMMTATQTATSMTGKMQMAPNCMPTPELVMTRYDWDNQINRTNWMFKYQSGEIDVSDMDEWEGPNYGCTIDPLTELTTVQDDINDAINAMDANGVTNIQQGLTWGWRTLSDNEPFTGGREDDDTQNIKYIVLLTDGNNYYSSDGDSTPNQTAYGAWGYARTEAPYNPINGDDHNRWLDGLDPLT